MDTGKLGRLLRGDIVELRPERAEGASQAKICRKSPGVGGRAKCTAPKGVGVLAHSCRSSWRMAAQQEQGGGLGLKHMVSGVCVCVCVYE